MDLLQTASNVPDNFSNRPVSASIFIKSKSRYCRFMLRFGEEGPGVGVVCTAVVGVRRGRAEFEA